MKEKNSDIHIIIDAGATKTEFAVMQGKELAHQFFATGINANYSTDEQIDKVFVHFVQSLPKDYSQPAQITYYGAGCAGEQNAMRIAAVIAKYFTSASFKIYSDLMEACHALCGKQPGLVAILGTGSSSCLYDGEKIVKRAPSLGYLIGDEGSGTHLGKKLVSAYMMEKLPMYMLDEIEKTFDINPPKVIQRIYRKASPNKFFASFSPFIQKYAEDPVIRTLCKEAFAEFFDNQIGYYDKNTYTSVSLMGSVAFHFKDIISEVAAEKEVVLGTIIGSPMPKLMEYHTQYV
ncbi:MAG: hypothetical protein J6P65_05930 [Bacteroidales bacterium]|nr:hypothetical protein [Bacteroidales bacterium]